jgi:hypothetical protein
MTAYIRCTECGGGVPHYYAWLFGPDAMHPGCASDRKDEEGAGPTWFHLTRIANEARDAAKGGRG